MQVAKVQKRKRKQSAAYATMLTDDSYLVGIQVLSYTLRQQGNTLPLVVLVSKDVTKVHRATVLQLYKLPNLVIKMVAPIANPYESDKIKKELEASGKAMPSWFGSAYTKLHIWALTEYKQVFYIDADCMIVGNVEHLFKLYEQSDFAASPDVFPPDHLNAGVLLIRPSMSVFTSLLRKSQQSHHSYDGGDTGLLNSIFQQAWFASEAPVAATSVASPAAVIPLANSSCEKDSVGLAANCANVGGMSVRCSRLAFGYNAQRILYWFTIKRTDQYWEEVKRAGDGLRIIHYSSSPKPWATMGKPGGDLELLWQQKYMEYSANKDKLMAQRSQ